MKFRFSFYLASFAAACMLFASCDEKSPEQPQEPQYSKPGTTISDGEQVPHPQIPLNLYVETKDVLVSPDGVSVQVTAVEENNIKFVCKPGANVASYKLDVWPLATVYNWMIDEGGFGSDARTVEGILLSHLFNTSGAGGYAFDPDILGDDYYEYEFDWCNTQYAQFTVQPDAQYVIAVAGCYDGDATASNMGELVLVYVETPSRELIGDPQVDIEVTAGYRSVLINHVPNADAKGVYYFGTNKDMLDPFVDAYGDRMLRDLIRHWSVPNDPVSSDNVDGLYYTIGPWTDPDPNLWISTVAFGVDANGTPSPTIRRKDFTLKEIPDNTKSGSASYVADPEATSCAYVEYEVWLSKDTRYSYHRTVTAEEAAAMKEFTEDQKKALALDIAQVGYGIANQLYSFDEAAGEAIGSDFTTRWEEVSYGAMGDLLEPETEYVVVAVTKNFYGELSDLIFSEPFTTDARVTDRPADNKSNVELTFTDVTRTSFTYNFTYDPQNTSKIYFICIDPVPGEEIGQPVYSVPEKNDSREAWMDFFYHGGMGVYMNIWERSMSGHDSYTLPGFDPGEKFEYAYVAEDMDGVVSEVKFTSVETKSPQIGPNPQVEIVPTFDSATGAWTVKFQMVKDVEKFRYYLGSDSDQTLPPYLYRLGTGDMTAKEFYTYWDSQVGSYGLETNYEAVTETSAAGEDHLAAAVAWGRNEDGSEAISKLEYVILTKDGEVKKISDYYPNFVEP